MFRGEFNKTVDQKGRAGIPADFRESMLKGTGDDALVVTKFSDGLIAYPESSWKDIEERVDAMKPGPLKTATLRNRIAPAKKCSFDGQGRIQIPPALREYAALEKEIVVVGMSDKIEIWNLQRHLEATAESEALLKEHEQDQADLGF